VAFNLSSIRRNTALAAPRVLVYGVEGIGKSTFAAGAPSPVFIQTEDGLGALQVDHFPIATRVSDVLDAIGSLFSDDHEFKTVVIDSLDWLETLIWRDIEAKYDAKDLAYGKGAMIAADKWREILDGLTALRNERGMAVVLIAHTEIKRFDSPETEPYDRYQPKLQARSSALVREWCDAVFFANYKTIVKKDDVGFNKTVARGISTGERMLFTSERPAYMAKNRYSLPESIPLSWEAFEKAITQ
jgi:hypothetical protein